MDIKKPEIKTVEVRENQEIKKIEVPIKELNLSNDFKFEFTKPVYSFKCSICGESEEVQSFSYVGILICKQCLKDLKEIILEKRIKFIINNMNSIH